MSGTRIWIVGVALVLALVLGCYLSGAILLWRLGLPVSQLGILSYGRYWWAYHDHAQYGPLIQSSGTIGFGLPVLLVLTTAVRNSRALISKSLIRSCSGRVGLGFQNRACLC